MQETQVWFLGGKGLLEKETAAHSIILSWRILWTEKLSGRSPWVTRVGHNLVTKPPPDYPGWSHLEMLHSLISFPNIATFTGARCKAVGVLWGRHHSIRYSLFLLKLYFPNPSLSRKFLQVPTLVSPSLWNLAWTALSDRLTQNPLGPVYNSLFVCAAFAASTVWSIRPWTPQWQSRACVLCFKGQIHLSASIFHEDLLSFFFFFQFSFPVFG